jgi:hypothetical protein
VPLLESSGVLVSRPAMAIRRRPTVPIVPVIPVGLYL